MSRGECEYPTVLHRKVRCSWKCQHPVQSEDDEVRGLRRLCVVGFAPSRVAIASADLSHNVDCLDPRDRNAASLPVAASDAVRSHNASNFCPVMELNAAPRSHLNSFLTVCVRTCNDSPSAPSASACCYSNHVAETLIYST